ncbi:DUF1499 domain-containing protein [Halobacillus campisalis]|uniref:DUF1499 domain-containing protein n=1 Tax=Halobacillus campisalis TaxID=435909 RepID=A0ABW2K292_9BACI|nr:DUF1499 domain-containing protein [Halobacillus campisalis]
MNKNYLGVKEGELAPCPKSPNCVSTNTDQRDKLMEPLPFVQSKDTTKTAIKSIIAKMGRSAIKDETDDYIHVVFTSKLLKFKDDVEFYLDDSSGLIHFRSASRTGYSDLGVNRKRMEDFSEHYHNWIEEEKN